MEVEDFFSTVTTVKGDEEDEDYETKNDLERDNCIESGEEEENIFYTLGEKLKRFTKGSTKKKTRT